MTAGRGVTHSERFDDPAAFVGDGLELLQSWVALPDDQEEIEPSCTHFPLEALPQSVRPGVWMRLIAGAAMGMRSPVKTYSPLFYLHARIQPAAGRADPAATLSATEENNMPLKLHTIICSTRPGRVGPSVDAYVFVTPEYNYSPPPSFANAVDFVYKEWNYKPCGFVSYGGVSGGLRAVQMERLHVTTLKMMPMVESVAVPMVARHLNGGVFGSNELIDASARTMLDELLRWARALNPMRA